MQLPKHTDLPREDRGLKQRSQAFLRDSGLKVLIPGNTGLGDMPIPQNSLVPFSLKFVKVRNHSPEGHCTFILLQCLFLFC